MKANSRMGRLESRRWRVARIEARSWQTPGEL
jgi:hypothetical protein